MGVVITKGGRKLLRKLMGKKIIIKKKKVIMFENEIVISKIIFGTIHEKPCEEFHKILHIPILITHHRNS